MRNNSLAQFLQIIEAHTKLLAFFFGCIFVTVMLILAIGFPQPTTFQYTVFRIILALAAAGVAGVIPGMIQFKANPGIKVMIHAGGALAVFAIVYFSSPAKLALNPAEPESIPIKNTITSQTLILGTVDAIEEGVYIINLSPSKALHIARLSNTLEVPVQFSLIGFPEQDFFTNLLYEKSFIQGATDKNVYLVHLYKVPQLKEYTFTIKDSAGGVIQVAVRLQGNWQEYIAASLQPIIEMAEYGADPEKLYQAARRRTAQEYKELKPALQEAFAGGLLVAAGQPEAAALAFAKAEKEIPDVVERLTANSPQAVKTALTERHEEEWETEWTDYQQKHKNNDTAVQPDLAVLDRRVATDTPPAVSSNDTVADLINTSAVTDESILPYDDLPEKYSDIEFVYIPSGCFMMGSNDDEKPVHEVCVDEFWMGKYEVTQGLWREIMGNNPSSFKAGNDYRAKQVSWEDTQKFIAKLNKKSGKIYRLPTEAEWEYACRANGSGRYCGGGNLDIDAKSLLFFFGISTSPMGNTQANDFGLYDMSGNAWEWCNDWYQKDYYSSSPQDNPTGPASGMYRVLRGYRFYIFSDRDSVYRLHSLPKNRDYGIGFRLVLPFQSAGN